MLKQVPEHNHENMIFQPGQCTFSHIKRKVCNEFSQIK